MNNYEQKLLNRKWNYLAFIEGYSTLKKLKSLLITYETI